MSVDVRPVTVDGRRVAPTRLSHLQRLEAESIYIMREVVAQAEKPVMLYSIGKDSSVMLHLALKTFYPGKPPFPFLHIDTTWKFREMYAFRDQIATEHGLELLVHVNHEGLTMGVNPFLHGSAVYTDVMKTKALTQALEKYGFDAALGGARRDEERSRAKERVFSFRSAQHRWDPKNQRPELWRLYNARKNRGESVRVFPLSNWTELDVWQYIHLEDIPIVPLYFAKDRPVVDRAGTRGFAGMIVSGAVRPGDRIVALPSRRESRVARIVTYDGDVDLAVAGRSVTLTLAQEIDVSRGEVIASLQAPPGVGREFEATIVWMAEEPMLRGRSYLIRVGTTTAVATIAPLKYKVNVDSLEHVAAEQLELNEIGVCEVELDRAVAFDRYVDNRDTGGFVLIDRITNTTVGAGLLNFELRRSQNVHWQAIEVDKAARSRLKHQRPCLIWLTGPSGAGKSTIANLVEKKLHSLGRHTYLLDGDNVRHGLNKDLGFTDADRVENVRRAAEVAKLMVDAGLIVLASFISPFRSERRMARDLLGEAEFIEVFVDTPLAVAEARDPKYLYAKCRRGEITNFTGVDSRYEPPEAPELWIETTRTTPEQAAELVLHLLQRRGVLEGE